jgi:site-specific DNA recombinase
VREIHDAGGRIYAPDAPADWTSPEGELQAGIMFAFAQYIRQRARAGLERAKENAIRRGIPVATRPPVGYRKRDDRRLEPDPRVALVVREVFERRAEGWGPSGLAELLESRGVATSQGSRTWSKQAVASLLRSRVYVGELSYGRDRRFVNPSAHEPIVDEGLWHAAQQPAVKRPQSPRGRGDYLLTGLLRCAACGYSLQGTRTSRGKRIYRCTRRHAGGLCPRPVRTDAELVEKAAEDAFWSLVADVTAKSIQPEAADQLRKAEALLDNAEHRLRQVMEPEAQDAAGDGWLALVRRRREARDAAAAAVGLLRSAQSSEQASPDVATLRGLWPTLTPAERRGALATKLDAVALGRRPDGALAFVVYPLGKAPRDLTRRGFRREPGLHPLDLPAGARVLTLEQLNEVPAE